MNLNMTAFTARKEILLLVSSAILQWNLVMYNSRFPVSAPLAYRVVGEITISNFPPAGPITAFRWRWSLLVLPLPFLALMLLAVPAVGVPDQIGASRVGTCPGRLPRAHTAPRPSCLSSQSVSSGNSPERTSTLSVTLYPSRQPLDNSSLAASSTARRGSRCSRSPSGVVTTETTRLVTMPPIPPIPQQISYSPKRVSNLAEQFYYRFYLLA